MFDIGVNSSTLGMVYGPKTRVYGATDNYEPPWTFVKEQDKTSVNCPGNDLGRIILYEAWRIEDEVELQLFVSRGPSY